MSSDEDSKPEVYDPPSLRKPESVADLGRDVLSLHHVFGQDVGRRGNLKLIEDDHIMYATSSAVVIEHLHSGKKQYVLGVEENGIGCVEVHPSRKFFAVGCRGFQANIYIYSYPDLKIRKVLRNGAERGYACMSFSADGHKLASVSMAPDYMLTIWEWADERMGLHAKAFGQDIWNVQFSSDDSRRLTTSGIGHIRFWKMAATFTGLKLQGSIGKFGKVDLSDIEHFVELPDGKVVSGTDSGSLLLWEGNFIKCRFVRSNGELCHAGAITHLSLDRQEKCLISASADGYIRWWDFSALDTAEVDSDHSMDFVLTPVAEVQVAAETGVRVLLDSGVNDNENVRNFIIIDTRGRLQTLSFNLQPRDEAGNKIFASPLLPLKDAVRSFSREELFEKRIISEFHAAAITGVDCCPCDHLAASCGQDGAVRCLDYVQRREIAARLFPVPATSLRWLPESLDNSGKSFAVGFSDGVIRVISLGLSDSNKVALLRRMVFKPHNNAVVDISFSHSGEWLATSGKDGIVFFQHCKPLSEDDERLVWDPIRFVQVSALTSSTNGVVQNNLFCESISWAPNEKTVLLSCNDGGVREVDLAGLFEAQRCAGPDDNSEGFSFEILLPCREVTSAVQVLAKAKSGVLSIVKPQSRSSTEEAESSESAVSAPESPSKSSKIVEAPQIDSLRLKMNRALHAINRSGSTFVASGSLSLRQHILCETDLYDEASTQELINGYYSFDGKETLTPPQVTALHYSWSKKFLLVGAADGSIIVRPSEHLEVFCRASAQNGALLGVTAVSMSFDDRFVLSVGRDGCLTVHRVRLDLLSQRAFNLYKDIDAGVFANEVIKRTSQTVAAPEPHYLSVVTTFLQSEEDSLFAASLIGKKPMNLLEQPLFRPLEEFADLGEGAYSIQDNRLKAEEDAKLIAAGDLKTRVRASVQTLQRDYDKIMRENESIPEKVRLSAKEIAVDQDFFDALERRGKELLDEVHRERSHDAERAEKLLQKIQDRLMRGLLIEEIPLAAFDFGNAKPQRLSRCLVYSLRTVALDETVVRVIAQVKAQLRQQELQDSQQRANELAHKKTLEAMEDMKQRLQQKKEAGAIPATAKETNQTISAKHQSTAGTSASSALLRRMNRKDRKDEISRHDQEKPNENDDDVRDIQAIKHAENTIGDYKLKSSEDYRVPEDQRINANKKLRQMAMLEDSMFAMRLSFNERFLALRRLKQQIIYAVRRNNMRIREIDDELNESSGTESLWEPVLDAEEFPEDFEEITEEELAAFVEASQGPWEHVDAPSHRVIRGNKLEIFYNKKTNTFEVRRSSRQDISVSESKDALRDFLCESSLVDFTPKRTEPLRFYEVKECLLDLPPAYRSKTVTSAAANQTANLVPHDVSMDELEKLQSVERRIPILRFTKSLAKERMQNTTLSAVQQKITEQRRQKLRFERQKILATISENVDSFKEAVEELRVERHQITCDLKLAEFKLLTLFQEYKLLLTFESRDNQLQQKQIRCKNEESEIASLSLENKSKLDGKTEEIQHWNEKLAHLVQEFKSLLPDNHPYIETLTKIFKKKLKRNKGNEEDNEEEEEEEEEDDDEDEDDDDDEEVEDICPPGCDQSLFDKILELREKKLDTEEICTDIQKSIDEFKKTGDRLRQREKQIAKESQQAELEVQQFQLQKQAALNQIRVVVPLRLSQLYTFEHSGLFTGPTDKSGVDLSNEDAEKLRSMNKRELTSAIQMKSHTLFSTDNLIRLKDRINELHFEIEKAKEDFKLLHKERTQLLKDKESKEIETQNWRDRCRDLQMLKFGREIDLDELESFSDRSKELEVEASLEQDRQKFEEECNQLLKNVFSAKEKLVEVTKENTKLLEDVAKLTNLRMSIAIELNNPAQNITPSSSEDYREIEERKRIKAYTRFQATELEALRTELNMLKRKEAPIFSYSTPPVPPSVLQNTASQNIARPKDDLVLPPIPANKLSK